MRNIFFVILMVIASLESVYADNIFVCHYNKIKLEKNGAIHKIPPIEEIPIRHFYNYYSDKLIVSFYAMMDNVEVTITKDGELVASDVFNMNAYEGIEYDMSECEKGEYVVYVVTDDGMQVLGSFYKE